MHSEEVYHSLFALLKISERMQLENEASSVAERTWLENYCTIKFNAEGSESTYAVAKAIERKFDNLCIYVCGNRSFARHMTSFLDTKVLKRVLTFGSDANLDIHLAGRSSIDAVFIDQNISEDKEFIDRLYSFLSDEYFSVLSHPFFIVWV